MVSTMIEELKEYENLMNLPDGEWDLETFDRFCFLFEHLDEYKKQEKREQKDLEIQRIIKECENKIVLTPKDVSAILGMGVNQVYGLFIAKGFPSIDLNGKKVIEKEAFFEWLKGLRGKYFKY